MANKQPEPYWSEIIKVYFAFHRDRYGKPPVFKGSAPRDLRLIVAMLREYAQKSGWEWDAKDAQVWLSGFLVHAYFNEPWLRDQEYFSLSELYKMREQIFSNYIKQPK